MADKTLQLSRSHDAIFHPTRGSNQIPCITDRGKPLAPTGPPPPPPKLLLGHRPLNGEQLRERVMAAAAAAAEVAKAPKTPASDETNEIRTRLGCSPHVPRSALLLRPTADRIPVKSLQELKLELLRSAARAFEESLAAPFTPREDGLPAGDAPPAATGKGTPTTVDSRVVTNQVKVEELRQALERDENLFGQGSLFLLPIICGLGCALVKAGEVAEALQLGWRATATLMRADEVDVWQVWQIRELALLMAARGEMEGSCQLLRQRLKLVRLYFNEVRCRSLLTAVAQLLLSVCSCTPASHSSYPPTLLCRPLITAAASCYSSPQLRLPTMLSATMWCSPHVV
jgi:hypothetical protein